jgi:hypothetical protein
MPPYDPEDPTTWAPEDDGAPTDDDHVESAYDSETERDADIFAPYQAVVASTPIVPPPVWKLVRIGASDLHVSSTGKIKPYRSLYMADAGLPVPGTPFRTYPIDTPDGEIKHTYVHEIVWYAFHGPIPDGWVVRHTAEVTRVPRRLYPNAVGGLALYPALESHLKAI